MFCHPDYRYLIRVGGINCEATGSMQYLAFGIGAAVRGYPSQRARDKLLLRIDADFSITGRDGA